MAGQDDEFEQVVREHGALMRRIARAHEADPALADELVQDIHLAVWRALPRFRGEAGLKTFIARIAHNRSISHVARAAAAPRRAPLDDNMTSPSATPEDSVVARDARRRLEAAVQNLPLSQKLVASLALEGFQPAEIANVLGISATAASVRLHRAKAALMDMFKETGDDRHAMD